MYVGSCEYADLCKFLQDNLPDFNATHCPANLAPFGIDCTCPFKLTVNEIEIVEHELKIPNMQDSAASFMATGNFNITVLVDDATVTPAVRYGCGKISFTMKKKPVP